MKNLILFSMLLISITVSAQNNNIQLTNTIATSGISFGSALAIAISWSTNKSIGWAILHGIFSWIYVIYFAIKRNYTA